MARGWGSLVLSGHSEGRAAGACSWAEREPHRGHSACSQGRADSEGGLLAPQVQVWLVTLNFTGLVGTSHGNQGVVFVRLVGNSLLMLKTTCL